MLNAFLDLFHLTLIAIILMNIYIIFSFQVNYWDLGSVSLNENISLYWHSSVKTALSKAAKDDWQGERILCSASKIFL